MVALTADMALLRTPSSPLLLSPSSRTYSPSRALSSAKTFVHFDGFLVSRNGAFGGTVQRRSRSRVCCARASVGEDRRGATKEPQFPPPGELHYFGKLSLGCVAGAIVVKYGSLCVPSVTRPDINLALLMISTPCLASVVLLALASVMSSDAKTRKQ